MRHMEASIIGIVLGFVNHRIVEGRFVSTGNGGMAMGMAMGMAVGSSWGCTIGRNGEIMCILGNFMNIFNKF